MGHERGRCATLKLAGCFGRKQTFNLAIVNDRDWVDKSLNGFASSRLPTVIQLANLATGE
jgi:hypothetical protein